MNVQIIFEIDSGAPYVPWYKGNNGFLDSYRWKNQHGCGQTITLNCLWVRIDFSFTHRPKWRTVKGTKDGKE